MINPGKLNDRILLQRRTEVEIYHENGGFYTSEVVWQDIGHVWSTYRPTGGREFREGVIAVGEERATFTALFRNDLAIVDRLIFQGKIWDIKSINRVGFNEAIDINAVSTGPYSPEA